MFLNTTKIPNSRKTPLFEKLWLRSAVATDFASLQISAAVPVRVAACSVLGAGVAQPGRTNGEKPEYTGPQRGVHSDHDRCLRRRYSSRCDRFDDHLFDKPGENTAE